MSTKSSTKRFFFSFATLQIKICNVFILYTDEAQFTGDGINNLCNEHAWTEVNPNMTVECYFQNRFSVNVWCGLSYDQLIGSFILLGRLNSELLEIS